MQILWAMQKILNFRLKLVKKTLINSEYKINWRNYFILQGLHLHVYTDCIAEKCADYNNKTKHLLI